MAEGPVTLTLKGGGDYKVPWLVVSGESVEEIVAKCFAYSPELGQSAENALHAVTEANALADVKATTGAVELPVHPEPPVTVAATAAQATTTLIKVAAMKSGKAEADLVGITTEQAQALIQGGQA